MGIIMDRIVEIALSFIKSMGEHNKANQPTILFEQNALYFRDRCMISQYDRQMQQHIQVMFSVSCTYSSINTENFTYMCCLTSLLG